MTVCATNVRKHHTWQFFQNRVLLNEDQKIIANQALCRSCRNENKGMESETSKCEFTDQQNIESDHHSSSSSKDHDFNKHLDKVEKDQMKAS